MVAHRCAMPRIISFLPILLLLAATTGGAPVTVAVSGIDGAKGRVHVDINPEGCFTKKGCGWSAEAPAVAGTTIVTIPDVPPGRYAAIAYYDANGNGKADTNFIGMPLEKVGFSNDVVVHFSRPNFAD